MIELNLESERLRLAELYSGSSDQELEQLVTDAPSLTEHARVVLQAELTRRGMKVELQDDVASGERAAPGKLVTLRRFWGAPEALLAKTILDSADVECFLGDENLVRMDWFWSNAIGGIKLWVREEDAGIAAELLAQEVPEELEVEGFGKYHQPLCPACMSFDVSFEELNKSAALATAWFLGVPVALKRHGWRCHSCRHQWEESDAAPP